jgi:hypothetical protein
VIGENVDQQRAPSLSSIVLARYAQSIDMNTCEVAKKVAEMEAVGGGLRTWLHTE